MCSTALRVTACTMLLHLSQVTPGLSCTFTLFKGATLTNINTDNPSEFYSYDDVTLEDCFKECYENPHCKALLFYQEDSNCGILVPGKGILSRDNVTLSEIYTFDRSVSYATCPTVKQWMAQQ